MSGSAIVIGVGARAGLGAALSRRFASEGLQVFAAGRTRQKLEWVASEIERAGGSAVPQLLGRASDSRRGADEGASGRQTESFASLARVRSHGPGERLRLQDPGSAVRREAILALAACRVEI